MYRSSRLSHCIDQTAEVIAYTPAAITELPKIVASLVVASDKDGQDRCRLCGNINAAM